MVAQIDFLRPVEPVGVARLPSAEDCPAQRVFREVRRHPAGGWAIAEPVDRVGARLAREVEAMLRDRSVEPHFCRAGSAVSIFWRVQP